MSWLVISGLILGSFIDLDHFYLPDRVTIGGMVLGVPLSFLVPELQGIPRGGTGWGANVSALCWSVGGLAFGFFFLWGIGWVFTKLLKKDAMGFGDVLIARGKAKLGGYTAVPFGPFLALGVLAWMFWGPAIISWYMGLHAVGR